MKANETKLQKVIEGTNQYVIPLFQRAYSWDKKEWEVLWNDIIELADAPNMKTHFIGSIVSMPTVSVPEGVAKYLLIDGQQRLTTIFVILALLRNRANELGKKDVADEIYESYLVNKFKKNDDHFKLLPTQADRATFKNIILSKELNAEDQLSKAHQFFYKKLRQPSLDTEKIIQVITNSFSIVSIVLDIDDNPYLVFESLNAKGRPLTQADLIRNYFFMRIHREQQEEAYLNFWQPMQNELSDSLTEYIRHFLMRDKGFIKQSDIYYLLKEQVSANNALSYLEILNHFSIYYQKLLNPNKEENSLISDCLHRLNRIEVTTAFPLLLNCYDYYTCNKITTTEFVELLKTLENYLIRRFVCGIATNQLNKIFPTIIAQIDGKAHEDLVRTFKKALQAKGYPKDNEFVTKLIESKLYGGGDRGTKTKLILETLEAYYNHKEVVSFDNVTIEHIMPQTLTDWWKNHLGNTQEDVHDFYLHTLGNLTLTAYNSELSNKTFDAKLQEFSKSKLMLNRYFANTNTNQWQEKNIRERAKYLATIALKIWAYFGEDTQNFSLDGDVTGTSPKKLSIMGQNFNIKTWRDVLEKTLHIIDIYEPSIFDMFLVKYPKNIGKDESIFREYRRLPNGYFIEVNLSAQSIQRFCKQLLLDIEIPEEEWYVSFD